MSSRKLELVVGIFVVLGFLSFVWLAVRLGDVAWFGPGHYEVSARFRSVSGLREGAVVESAGVRIGRVTSISLDPRYYEAVIGLEIAEGIALPRDSIASIRTAGLIGEKYIDISPGGDLENIPPGGEIVETESAIVLEELLGRFIFQEGGGGGQKPESEEPGR